MIKRNKTIAPIILVTGDNVLLAPSSGRYAIQHLVLSETTGGTETIELYRSTTGSSSAAQRLEKIIFAADEVKEPTSALITIDAGESFILKATTGSKVTANIVYTEFTGDS